MAMAGMRRLQDVIDEIGFGRSQLLTGILVNGSWLADGAELFLISAVASSIGHDWGRGSLELGSLISAVYLGMLCGQFLSGYVGDRYGRRSAVLMCYPVIIASSVGSALSNNYWQLLLLRFIVGFGMGVGQPSALVIGSEVTPKKYRSVALAGAQLSFAFGALYSCLAIWLDDPQMEHLHWRNLLVVGAVPALIFWLLAWRFLDESPSFLAANGRADEAKAVLERMRLQNGSGETSLEFTETKQDAWMHLSRLISWHTAALCLMTFSFNFLLNGSFAAFPQILPKLFKDKGSSSPVAKLAFGNIFEIPCDILGMVIGGNLPRKHALYLYFLGAGISTALFALGQNEAQQMVGYLGVKGWPQIVCASLICFVTESFPVEIRTTGTAFVCGCGRIGAIVAPCVYGYIVQETGSHVYFFLLCTALQPVCGLAAAFLQETENVQPKIVDDRTRLEVPPELSHGTMSTEMTYTANLKAIVRPM